MTADQYIAANAKRRAQLEEAYDPYVGIGSPVERVTIPLGRTVVSPLGTATDEFLVPVAMLAHSPLIQEAQKIGLSAFAEKCGLSYERIEHDFSEIRFAYDFEFWCAVKARIKNKSGEVVPFVLNRPQRKYLARLEAQRLAGKPVRQIVLKHRQWGCTTFSYTYVAWHQAELYTGRDAWFIGLDKSGAGDVRNRYDMIRESCGFTIKNYDQTGNTKAIVERDALVSIGTVERPNAPSGRPAQFVHLFEVGKWPSNPTVSAEKVAQNVGAMLVDEPGTIEIIESTAQASTGTYFMEICQKAQLGQSAYDFLFVSWLDDPQYARELDDCSEESVGRFVSSWGDTVVGREYCEMLWQMGATLEQIAWYIYQAKRPEYSDRWRLMEEFPTTSTEAFQHGGKRKFPAPYVETARKTCKEPLMRGHLVGAARSGPDAFREIRFESDPRGPLKIWRLPDEDYGGLIKRPVVHRHCAASDIGPGQWEGADFNCCAVLDRAPVIFGGMPEIAAEWHGHLDKDLFAWESARLAYWYGKALLAVEVNSLLEDNETRYDAGQTVLDEIVGIYPKLYIRRVMDSVTQKVTEKVGFHMNAQTKEQTATALNKRLREFHEHVHEGRETIEGYVERCLEATNEMDLYMVHEDGSMGATSRSERSSKTKKDDRVVVRMILMWLHGELPQPAYMPEPVRRNTKPSMAGFN